MRITKYTLWLSMLICISACTNNNSVSDNINSKASFADGGKFSPAGLKVITTFVNRKQGTMSTLYGNTSARQQAAQTEKAYTGEEMFALVTWKQQPDEHWFGANIPGEVESVEVLKAKPGGATGVYNYERYTGNAMVPGRDTLNNSKRIRFILDQRASVMP